MRRAVWPLLATVVVAVLFLAVFPTRTFLGQRAAIQRAEHQLGVLRGQADELQRHADALDTDAEIERLAREQYSLVRPGEQAFAVLPPPAAATPPTYWEGLLGPLGAVDGEG